MEPLQQDHNGTGRMTQQQTLPIDLEQAKKRFDELSDQALDLIRERPGTCLFGALAFGFLVGRFASRR